MLRQSKKLTKLFLKTLETLNFENELNRFKFEPFCQKKYSINEGNSFLVTSVKYENLSVTCITSC